MVFMLEFKQHENILLQYMQVGILKTMGKKERIVSGNASGDQ